MNHASPVAASDVLTQQKTASWASVGAVGVGAFAIVTTEFLPVGLLSKMAETLGQSDGRVGLMVTIPGVLGALAAPASVWLSGKFDRRWVLVALMGLLVISNLIVSTAASFEAALFGRMLLGVAVGCFWTLGGSLGPRLRPEAGAKASALILSGVSLGTVAGVPAGALLGELIGWRWAFGLAGAIALLVLVVLIAVLPPIPPGKTMGIGDVRQVLRSDKVRLGIAVILLLHVSHFGAYTFISPFLLQVTRIPPVAVGGVLLAYGVAALPAI